MDTLNGLTPERLWLHRDHWEQMESDVSRRAPEEACGLIAGRQSRSLEVIPVTNVLHSPVRFRMDPKEQIEAFNRIEACGWDLLAIYHSHPAGPTQPSPTDTAEIAYPSVVHLIWSLSDKGWNCRGFLIDEGQLSEVPIHIIHE